MACDGVTVARSSCGGMSSAFAAFSHITRTLCMWATMAATVRPLPSGGFAAQAADGRLSIKYWLMRLFVLNALSSATGSWLAYGVSGASALRGGFFGMVDLQN